MMIPIAVRTTEEFLRSVPINLREGAMALGATKAKTIFTVRELLSCRPWPAACAEHETQVYLEYQSAGIVAVSSLS